MFSFGTLMNFIPWGSIIMEGVNGLCEIVDDFFGNTSNKKNTNTYNSNRSYAEPVRVAQPQYNNTMNTYSNNTIPQQSTVFYNEEGKRMIQGVYFIA